MGSVTIGNNEDDDVLMADFSVLLFREKVKNGEMGEYNKILK